MSDVSQGAGWWIASDGKWYPPELHPSQREGPTPPVAESVPARYAPAAAAPVGMTDPVTALPNSWPATWNQGGAGATASAWTPMTPSAPWATAPAPRWRRRPVVIAAIVVAVLVLLVAGLVVGLGSSGPGYPATWNPRVLSIVHFVQRERGLTFKHPVKVEFLDTKQFNKEVAVPQPQTTADKASSSRAVDELRALGLVHGNVNLAQSENALNQSDVVGLYVDTKKTVFVRGSALTPFVRVTLAHELTHALQDQYFDLTKLDEDTPGDGSALDALIEGDAVRVQNAYEQTLSAADQRSYEKASGQFGGSSGATAKVPEILSDMADYPYVFGPTFVDDLVAAGGTAAIDNAFRHPPLAQAQILDPVAYPVGWKPAKVAAPSVPRGDPVTDPVGPFGQLTLFEVLGSRLGYSSGWTAVQGWQGDSSLAYRRKGRTCDAISVRMRTTAEAATLSAAAHQWAADVATGAVIGGSGRLVTIRSCDPGPHTPAAAAITPSAFDVLSARAQLIDLLITQGHVDFALGACTIDNVLATLGPSGYPELLANSLPAAEQTQLEQLLSTSVVNCRSSGVT
ncbi:MAG: hypothetical protein ACRDY1_05985 [Acidimicrobiales bacterium]